MKEIKSKQTDSVTNVNYKFQFKYFSQQIVSAKHNLLLRHYRTEPITTGFRTMTLRFANDHNTSAAFLFSLNYVPYPREAVASFL